MDELMADALHRQVGCCTYKGGAGVTPESDTMLGLGRLHGQVGCCTSKGGGHGLRQKVTPCWGSDVFDLSLN